MPNDVKLQSPEGNHPVDSNLRPILVGGKPTAIETAQHGNGARITGGLEVSGTGKPIVAEPLITDQITSTDLTSDPDELNLEITSSGGMMLKASTDIGFLPATGQDLNLYSDSVNKTIILNNGSSGTTYVQLNSILDTGDYFKISTTTNGATTIATVDDGNSEAAHLTLDIQGDTIFKGDIADGTSTEVARIESSASSLLIPSGKRIEFGNPGEFIYGNGSNMFIGSSGTLLNTSYSTNTIRNTNNGSIVLDAIGGVTEFRLASDSDDLCKLTVAANGVTTISTEDSDGAVGHLELAPDGKIILNSASGGFEMHGGGTTAKFADMYAGMLLGCTHVFGSGTGGAFIAVSNSWVSLVWDTDKYALVTFVVPPSNKVKISVHLPFIAAASVAFQLGLATDSSATTLDNKYANDVDDANRSDSFNINYSWVVEGSDHSWSAGETKTLYIMAYAISSIRFRTGGTNAGNYGGVIVESTALPATIGDGSEP